MNTKKTKLQKIIEKNTVSAEEVFRGFTPEQKQIVEIEKKKYYMVMELRKARQAKNLTQKQLAKKANLPRTTITKLESGTYNPTIHTLMSIASAMNKKLEVKFV